MAESIPTLNAWTSLFLFASAQGFFLVLLLLGRFRQGASGNIWLLLLVVNFSITLIDYVGFWSGYQVQFPHFSNIYLPLALCVSPLFYLYLRDTVITSSKEPAWWHFILVAAFLISQLPYYTLSGVDKTAMMQGNANLKELFQDWQPWFYLIRYHSQILIVQLFFYGFLIMKTYWSIADNQPFIKRWAKVICIFYSCYALLYIGFYLMIAAQAYQLYWDYAISFAMAFFIYGVGWLGYRQPEIFAGKPLTPVFKYQNSALTDDAARSLHQRLLAAMETEQLYLDNELRLHKLAEHLQTTPHLLSQVLNEKIGKSYAAFINAYRIAAAKQQLADPKERETYVINIAYAVGFNNKTSFNKAFKSETGISPTEYRKRLEKMI